MDGRGSPSPSLIFRNRRSKEVSSSLESLTSVSLNQSSCQRISASLKESDEEVDDGSPVFSSPVGSRSASPDKQNGTCSSLANHDCSSDGGERCFTDFNSSKSEEKRPRSAQDNYETPVLNTRNNRYRSFEHSLDNILDKCSEKSLDLNLSVDSWNSQEGGKSPDQNSGSSGTRTSKSDKRKNRWYSIMSPTYKSRNEDFHRMFKDVPKTERLIVDYSCALQKDILAQGRMYICQNWICFYAKIFNWETMLMIPCKEIVAVTKEKTARVIPNAIQITTDKDRFFFTSFGARDKTYLMLFRIWQNALLDQPMSPKEQWTWVHYSYGADLGLTSEDDDYVAPQSLQELTEKLKEEILADKEDIGDLLEAVTTPAESDSNPFVKSDMLLPPEAFPLTLTSSDLVHPLDVSMRLPLIPANFSESSDDSEGEYFCNGHSHLDKMYLDEVFNINIDTVFECVFTDSTFFRTFVASRKTFDLNLPNWEEDLDEDGNKVRNISYTLTLNNSIGPKISQSTEKQICYSMSKPGRIYHIDCECCNGGVPYADSFYVLLRYCLTRKSPTRCRVMVTGEVKYRKQIMGMFRGMIEKTAVNGITDYCRQLSVHLRNEAQRLEAIVVGHQMNATKKKIRRKRAKAHSIVSESGLGARQAFLDRQTSTPPSPAKGMYGEETLGDLNAHSLVRIITVVLIMLLLVNAMLFYKLWSLEMSTNVLFSAPSHESLDHFSATTRTSEEWRHLLEQQRNIHESEMRKWHEVLSVSINIVEQMKASLISLQNSLTSDSGDAGNS